ncbi:MAG TPA: carboxypeptidase-like regulatory domain-containing protein, partial [Herpetosiphonaceae bacterium]|nr:carboxypeptidase-like regulatory domain-containing protein [Herpetosiphonaceae bacterium]
GVGGSLLVEQHAKASPTTIRMVGVVREPSGKALANAQVELSNANPGDPGAFQPITVRTDAQGHYTATAILNRDVAAGGVAYRIRYFQARLDETRQYDGLNLNQLNTVAQNFELATRSLTLKGHVEHSLVPGFDLRGRLFVASPVHGTLCDQQIGADGTYQCAVAAITTNAFSLTYTLVSDWGTAVFAGEVPAGETGGATAFTKDLLAAPRIIRLRGTIRGADNAPLAGVKIGVISSDLSVNSAATMETDAQGAYDQYAILKADRASGTLTYQLRAGTARGAVPVPYAAPTGQVTTVTKDILFTSREVTFSGVVRNAYAPAMTVAGARVAISSPVLGDLCSATSLADGAYACSLQVLNPESFPVAYEVVGDWGSGAFAGAVGAGSVGGSSALAKDLALRPTTLRLSGTVTDAAGAPLAGAVVKASGANVVASTEAVSAEGGAYEIYVMIRAGIELETIEYRLTFGAQSVRNRQAYRFEAGALTSVAADLTFAVRSFTFKGRVANGLAPEMALKPVRVEIASPTLGGLCSVMSQAGNGFYTCTVEVNTRDPFTVTYGLSGDWGSEAVSHAIASLPPLGGAATVEQDLDIHPTTLIVRGTVSDNAGAPLAGVASSVVTSTLISGLNQNLAAQTDATGAYTLPIALRQNVAAGDLAMQFRRGTLVVGSSAAFAAAAGAATEIRRDATIAERQLSFRGTVANVLAGGVAVGAGAVEISSPELGLLCRWERGSQIDPASRYGCDANVGTTGAISLTYTVSGDWGSEVISGTAPAGPFGGSLTVERELAVRPTTLKLIGKATNREGAAVAGVVVQASSAGMSASAHRQHVQAITGADGSYEVLMVLEAGVESGQIQYAAKVNDISLFESGAFTATLKDISEARKNLVFNERSVRFLGNITNQLANNQELGAYAVEVSSPGMGTLCTARPAQGVIMTSYACEAKISSSEPFTVTYTVSGDWGQEIQAGSVPAGATGALTLVTRPLALRPTTLRLTGVVSDPYNRRLSSAQVLAGGDSVAIGNSAPSDYTDGEGAYEFFVALRQGVVSGTLNYTTRYANAAVDQPVPFEAAPGQLTSIEQPVSFNARGASFSGSIKHALLPWMALQANSVVVRDGQGQVLCEWTPKWYESGTAYACQGQVATTDAVTTTYTVNGAWGSEVISGQIPANDYATSSAVARDLLPTPTTLRLRGVARNAGGAALANVTVKISGPDLLSSAQASTQANGEYEVFALLRSGATGGALTYKATYQAITVEATAAVTAAPRAITAVARDFTFTSRLVDFSGQVRAELAPGLAINTQRVLVESPLYGQLCEWYRPSWNTPSADYFCQATLFTSEPVSVTYTVSHDWGTRVVSATVPAGALGTRATFSQNLGVRPAILRLSGSVSDAEGAPLANAYLQVRGDGFSAGNRSLSVVTDASGAYSLDVVV